MSSYLKLGWLIFAAVVFAAVPAPASLAGGTLLEEGYRQMYNLEFDAAHQSFAVWERQHPGDPMGPISDAAAYLFSEFDRLHILQSEFFTDDENFTAGEKPPADPVVKQKFANALAVGQKMAERILAQKPNDPNALFAQVMRLGLHADYLALIEKRQMAALSEMKTGRAISEKLLALDPNYGDAYLAIGAENYLLSLKSMPLRWLLRMGGAQTDKDRGIQTLRIAVDKAHYLGPYARILLAVASLRDNDRKQAREILQGLAREFPQNRLYLRELARLR